MAKSESTDNVYIPVRLHPESAKKVREYADLCGYSMNHFVNQAVDAVIAMVETGKVDEPDVVAMTRFMRKRKK